MTHERQENKVRHRGKWKAFHSSYTLYPRDSCLGRITLRFEHETMFIVWEGGGDNVLCVTFFPHADIMVDHIIPHSSSVSKMGPYSYDNS